MPPPVAARVIGLIRRAGTTRLGVLAIGRIVSPLQRTLYRATGGRISLTGRAPVLLLTTTGRQTLPVAAHPADEAQLERCWPRLVELWPAYRTFEERGGRRTVFVLEPSHGPPRTGERGTARPGRAGTGVRPQGGQEGAQSRPAQPEGPSTQDADAGTSQARLMEASTGTGPKPGTPGRCRFDLAVAIGRPPADVYAFLADVQEAVPRRTVRMVKDPPGDTAVGTVWHESVRFAPGVWLHVDSVVTDAQPPHRLGMDFRSLWFSGHLTYEIEPAAGGSVLRQREALVPRRLLRPFGGVIERQLRPRLRQRLDDVRTVLEERQRPPGR